MITAGTISYRQFYKRKCIRRYLKTFIKYARVVLYKQLINGKFCTINMINDELGNVSTGQKYGQRLNYTTT